MQKDFLLISGMFRSGTSAFAKALMEAGVNLGDNLIPGDVGNPKGYFEDSKILKLHNDILNRNGRHYLLEDSKSFTLKTNEADVQLGKQILAEIEDCNPDLIPAFKDGRIAFFLDFWFKILEDRLKLVVLFRHPIAVMDSLIRRNTDPSVTHSPLSALTNWNVFNQRYLSFYEENPHRTCFIEADRFIRKPQETLGALKEFINFQLDAATTDSAVSKKDYKLSRLYSYRIIRELIKDPLLLSTSLKIYSKLKRIASH